MARGAGPALLLVALALSAAPAAASGQSAEDIMNRALETYESRIEGVENYTVTQEVMGFTTTSYFVKRQVAGHPVFTQPSNEGTTRAPEGWGNPYRLFPQLARRAELQGRSQEGGETTWALTIDDFSGLDVDEMAPSGVEGEFEPRRATFYLDTDDYAIRRLVLDGEMATDSTPQPINMDARFSDYREVEGMLHPFLVEIRIKGMQAVMSDEDVTQARQQLRQLRDQMEQMPDQQRQMMEKMLGPRLEQLERMVESGDAVITVRVRDLEVNEGPPEATTGTDGGS